MAGGTFDKQVGKVRPGTYINFTSAKNNAVTGAIRGTVVVPLTAFFFRNVHAHSAPGLFVHNCCCCQLDLGKKTYISPIGTRLCQRSVDCTGFLCLAQSRSVPHSVPGN